MMAPGPRSGGKIAGGRWGGGGGRGWGENLFTLPWGLRVWLGWEKNSQARWHIYISSQRHEVAGVWCSCVFALQCQRRGNIARDDHAHLLLPSTARPQLPLPFPGTLWTDERRKRLGEGCVTSSCLVLDVADYANDA